MLIQLGSTAGDKVATIFYPRRRRTQRRHIKVRMELNQAKKSREVLKLNQRGLCFLARRGKISQIKWSCTVSTDFWPLENCKSEGNDVLRGRKVFEICGR